MKKLSIFSAAVLSLAISGLAQAQQSATGTGSASAEVQSENISIEEQTALDFGRVSPFSTVGTVNIRPSDNRQSPSNLIRTAAGTRGEWVVTGFANASFAVSITDSFTLTSEDGQDTMQVTGVNVGLPTGSSSSTLNNISSTTITSTGERRLAVGGTLNVGGGQASGVYSGQYQITVIYN
ncbi:DUF4402 domain-containing protein [Sessilibacter corallicola]|uniref:DUF4402 domain-containing protein n=1 Tax=Sessilibacter corallicola TaxID=2904075 RepID=UPI001E2AC884|nr:DUF4402 domain-containing protein [Sessilibacter corallicola]MCE2026734.1 DUF4402 domain-containing protein [Sessilibacter corallicola]